MTHKLNEKAEGESPRVTLRMDAGCMKIVERVARQLARDTGTACDKSRAIRAIVQAHSMLQVERDDAARERDAYKRTLGENDMRLMIERDKALAERDSAREALKNALKELDALRSVPVAPVAPVPVSAPATHDLDALKRSAKEAGVSVTEFNSSRYKNDALRARWTALKVPLRPFVARHDITRTPFQKWAAGERDMHGETLARYEAAIAVEEAAK